MEESVKSAESEEVDMFDDGGELGSSYRSGTGS